MTRPISPEQLAANRANARKSTGPKTDEGKAASRRNSWKHGLTGEGVVLPGEDEQALARRFEGFARELDAPGEVGRFHAGRAAHLSVRLDRSARHEAAALTSKMLRAASDFDEARHAEVDRLLAALPELPATGVRNLSRTPEGIDRMLGAVAELRADLAHAGSKPLWTEAHLSRLENLLGRRADEITTSRAKILSEVVLHRSHLLAPGDAPGLVGLERIAWAKQELLAVVDAQVARLEAARHALDLGAIDHDRQAAMDLALVDPSPEMVLARRYEAATVRELNRTFAEIRRIKDEAGDEDRPAPTINPNPIPEPTSPEMGSFFPVPPPRSTPPPAPMPRPGSPADGTLALPRTLTDAAYIDEQRRLSHL